MQHKTRRPWNKLRKVTVWKLLLGKYSNSKTPHSAPPPPPTPKKNMEKIIKLFWLYFLSSIRKKDGLTDGLVNALIR